nr:DGCR6 [synthetic construct]
MKHHHHHHHSDYDIPTTENLYFQGSDQKIVLELDRKVADQQSTLEKAGVAGFYVTTNPQELMLQMNLLELIRKLQQRGCWAGKAALGLGGPWQLPAAQCDQKGSPVPP